MKTFKPTDAGFMVPTSPDDIGVWVHRNEAENAITAERERCAKIIESYGDSLLAVVDLVACIAKDVRDITPAPAAPPAE